MSWFSHFWRRLWPPSQPARTAPRPQRFNPDSTRDYPEAADRPPSHPPISTGRLQLRYGVVSITGNVREHNEDSFFVPPRPPSNHAPVVSRGPADRDDDAFTSATTADFPLPQFGPSGLFVVADGMGGQLAGEKASQMAVDLIPREIVKRIVGDQDEKATQRALRDAVAKANDEILALSLVEPEYANMGTTVVLAHFQGDRAYVAGIGDSRVYRLRGERLEQLTRDHSLANALGESGSIRPEEVETHKFKHVLYLYLGSKDARDGPEDVRVVDCRAGDQFLLASDGLMGVVRDDMIADMMRSYTDPQQAAQALVDRALELRSKDNITALVIHLA